MGLDCEIFNFRSFSNHARIVPLSTEAFDICFVEILNWHFLRKSRTIRAFKILDFNCWCVWRGERNALVTFSTTLLAFTTAF